MIFGPLVHEFYLTFKQNREYKQNYNSCSKEHPDKRRKLCMKCKHRRLDTRWQGRYPNGIPERYPTYCRKLNRTISGINARCLLADPPDECLESTEDILYPSADTYVSAHGNCFHSTPSFRTVRNSQKIYKNHLYATRLRACPNCWKVDDGKLIPR